MIEMQDDVVALNDNARHEAGGVRVARRARVIQHGAHVLRGVSRSQYLERRAPPSQRQRQGARRQQHAQAMHRRRRGFAALNAERQQVLAHLLEHSGDRLQPSNVVVTVKVALIPPADHDAAPYHRHAAHLLLHSQKSSTAIAVEHAALEHGVKLAHELSSRPREQRCVLHARDALN
jgi:hypothetical protein